MTDTELSAQYENENENADAGSNEAELPGITLQPYTTFRAWAAQAMGLKYGFVDEASRADFGRTGLYPGSVRDCGVVLWLRSLTNDAEIDRAARFPVAAAATAAKWAHENKLDDVTSDNFRIGYKIFFDTMEEASQPHTSSKG